jgi:hypothetical protein
MQLPGFLYGMCTHTHKIPSLLMLRHLQFQIIGILEITWYEHTLEEYFSVEEYKDQIEVNTISNQKTDICHSIVSSIGFQICFKM